MYPQLKNFKEFVRGLEPNVDGETACKQFKEFKTNLTRVEVDKFFDEHKHEEWFKNKYHPQDSLSNNIYRETIFTKRCEIFNNLLNTKHFDTLAYNFDFKEAILNTLNGIIILLENGPHELADTLFKAGNNHIVLNEEHYKFLPKTPNSILLENLNVNTTVSDVESVCKKTDSEIKHLAFLDPYYVKGGELRHRVIVKFQPQVDIRETCWKLGRSQINGQDPNAYICSIPTNRVRSVDFKTNHRLTVIKDIRNAIRIILNLDELRGLHGRRKNGCVKEKKLVEDNGIKRETSDETGPDNHNEDIAFGVAPPSPPGSEKSIESFDISCLDQDREKEKKKLLDMKFDFDLTYRKLAKKTMKSSNPLLSNAIDYLTDYTCNTCFTYLLSRIPPERIGNDRLVNEPFEPKIEYLLDNLPFSYEENVKTLDRLLWYLRIVHSFDYYSMRSFKHEDIMPLKLTFVHVRGSPSFLDENIDLNLIKEFNENFDKDLMRRLKDENQTYLTKEEEKYVYRSYKKNIQNELESYAEQIPNPKNVAENVVAYKCKHCTKMFQKLQNVGLHFVSKHREAIDFIEMETDFFNTYMFDTSKIDPKPPKILMDVVQNKFVAELNKMSKQVFEESDLLRETIEIYKKIEPTILQEAPRKIIENSTDPRASEMEIDYDDISFDDAL